MKVLHLSLKKQPFDVMVTGEKKIEYRESTDWMLSRLRGKTYDFVKFVNGYGADKPYFICKFIKAHHSGIRETQKYSNGLKVSVAPDTIKIILGEITEKGNLKTDAL